MKKLSQRQPCFGKRQFAILCLFGIFLGLRVASKVIIVNKVLLSLAMSKYLQSGLIRQSTT